MPARVLGTVVEVLERGFEVVIVGVEIAFEDVMLDAKVDGTVVALLE